MKIVSKSGLGLEHYNVNIESNQWDVCTPQWAKKIVRVETKDLFIHARIYSEWQFSHLAHPSLDFLGIQ